jgi:V8-like Glu-specific endopeptidase
MSIQIRPNRLEVSDRFPMLGFTVRTDGNEKQFEIAVGTSPDLFGPDGKGQRNRGNFYSTRATGPLPIERGEAVYVLPSEVLARFVGRSKLYFGLGTGSNGSATVATMPGPGSLYVNIGGLTGRSLQRVRLLPSRQRLASNYGKGGSELEWAGDLLTPGTLPATPRPAKTDASKTGASSGGTSAPSPVLYDDGYGPLPPPPPPSPGNPGQPAQAKSLADDASTDDPHDEDAQHGIAGPVPDEVGLAQGLGGGTPSEYPQASRFEPAASTNFRAVTGTRTINRIVIHITDGGPKIGGTIAWFKDASARVSAHYVVGQDGEVVQMVKHNDVAWHASSANSDSIGIEHVARSPHAWDKPLGRADPGLMPTGAQYCASAALVNWLCSQFGIPMDRSHILGHSEASPRDHHDGCPNSVWDWDYYMGMVTSGTCMEDPASASALASIGAPRMQKDASSPPRARALRQVDPGYAPGNAKDALLYMQQFQDRRQAWKAGVPDTTFFPHSAICRLRIFQPDGEYIGTGFFIGKDRILTCAHNLVQATDVTIIPGKNDSAEPFGAFSARPSDWAIHPKYDHATADSSPTGHDFDLAVIKTAISPPNGLSFDILEELLQCQESPIIVCGYAADTVSPDKQHLDGDEIRMLNDSGETVLYNLQTEPGNSGSPVYYVAAREDDERQQSVLETRVVGVHLSSDSKVFNQGCRLTAAKIAWINSVGKPVSAGASVLSLGHTRHDRPRTVTEGPAPVRAQDAQPASTTSGVGDGDDASGILACIQGLTDQGRSITFVQRYLRSLTTREVTALSNAGLQIVSCFEVGSPTQAAYFTRAQGERDGRAGFAQAQNLGQPGGTPIYFAVDFDPGPAQRQAILDYFEGVQEGCRHHLADMEAKNLQGTVFDIGVYGSGCVLDWCRDQGIATWFWQAFAPGWCSNRKVWQGANLRTTGLDTPKRCGLRLDHLEGWGNEGGWAAASVQGQALSSLPPAPPPQRKYARGQSAEPSPRLVGNSPVETEAGGEGNVTWELDQFPGMKTATPSAVGPMQSAETIHLSNWPYCDHANGSRASAWFAVDWKFSGQGLGQIRITPAGAQPGAHPLRVEARIEDGQSRDPGTASLLVRFTYRFSTADGPEVVAQTELTLYGDGSVDQRSNWMSQVAVR